MESSVHLKDLPWELQGEIFSYLTPAELAQVETVDQARRAICRHPLVRRPVFEPYVLQLPEPMQDSEVEPRWELYVDLEECLYDRWLLVGYKYGPKDYADLSYEEQERIRTEDPVGPRIPFAALVFLQMDRRGGWIDDLILEDKTALGVGVQNYGQYETDFAYFDIEDEEEEEQQRFYEERSRDEGGWKYWSNNHIYFKNSEGQGIEIPVNFWSLKVCPQVYYQWDPECEEYTEEFEEEEEEEFEEENRKILLPYLNDFHLIENLTDLEAFSNF